MLIVYLVWWLSRKYNYENGDRMTEATAEDTELAVAYLHGNLQPMHDARYTVHWSDNIQLSLFNRDSDFKC